VPDFHATMLLVLGIDHKRLTVKFQGLGARLTGIAANGGDRASGVAYRGARPQISAAGRPADLSTLELCEDARLVRLF
jgi:hypothetical protein